MLLELRNVAFSYGKNGAPDSFLFTGLDLSVGKGELVVIRGPSGSGKSTILRLICRLQEPSSGVILFRNEPVSTISPPVLRSSICYVPQVPVMVDGTVADNLLLPFSFASNRSKPRPSLMELEMQLEKFYLSDIRPGHSAQKLSVGQKQRLALMRTLLQRPELLLLDEPTSSLDRESAAMVFSIIEHLNRQDGMTVILVTHSDQLPDVPDTRMFLLRQRKLEPA